MGTWRATRLYECFVFMHAFMFCAMSFMQLLNVALCFLFWERPQTNQWTYHWTHDILKAPQTFKVCSCRRCLRFIAVVENRKTTPTPPRKFSKMMQNQPQGGHGGNAGSGRDPKTPLGQGPANLLVLGHSLRLISFLKTPARFDPLVRRPIIYVPIRPPCGW